MKQFIYLFIGILLGSSCNPTPRPTKSIDFEADGMLILKTKRTFIIGAAQLPPVTNPYQALARAGFNLVHLPANRSALDSAHQAGLAAWITVGSIDTQNLAASTAKLRNLISEFKDHPALLYWETVDQPAWTWRQATCRIPAKPLITTYQLIKLIDPVHLVYLNHAPTNLTLTLEKYNSATDIIGGAIYPVIVPGTPPMFGLARDGFHGDVLNTYISQVGEYTERMRQVAGSQRPVFMMLQAFAWENLRPTEQNPAWVRYPTQAETRFMAYQAIINGATGLHYWGLAHTPPSAPFWKDLQHVVTELASIQDILAAPSKDIHLVNRYHELGFSVDQGVQTLMKKARGTYFLISVNADKNPVKVSISGFGREKFVQVLFENRKIQIASRELTDIYQPFDVHIYQLTNQ
ncbi:hypothetical protein L0128_13835 [candidate division KSB1 bacterium]|nr:hypothetical protein [candidate division KSB1 bacterium]